LVVVLGDGPIEYLTRWSNGNPTLEPFLKMLQERYPDLSLAPAVLAELLRLALYKPDGLHRRRLGLASYRDGRQARAMAGRAAHHALVGSAKRAFRFIPECVGDRTDGLAARQAASGEQHPPGFSRDSGLPRRPL
jgi:hypothetical protein